MARTHYTLFFFLPLSLSLSLNLSVSLVQSISSTNVSIVTLLLLLTLFFFSSFPLPFCNLSTPFCLSFFLSFFLYRPIPSNLLHSTLSFLYHFVGSLSRLCLRSEHSNDCKKRQFFDQENRRLPLFFHLQRTKIIYIVPHNNK